MIHSSDAFNAMFMKFNRFHWLSLLLSLALFSVGCSKGPAGNESASKNTNSANANQKDLSAALPVLQPTLKGDIERASLAISMARDAVKQNKWQDALSQLQAAKKETESALTRQPSLRDEFEALKAAIDRAIEAVEGRGSEATARVAELQTRIGAIKVNSFLQ